MLLCVAGFWAEGAFINTNSMHLLCGCLNSNLVSWVKLSMALSHLPEVLDCQLHQPEQLHVVVAGQHALCIDAALLQCWDHCLKLLSIIKPNLYDVKT